MVEVAEEKMVEGEEEEEEEEEGEETDVFSAFVWRLDG